MPRLPIPNYNKDDWTFFSLRIRREHDRKITQLSAWTGSAKVQIVRLAIAEYLTKNWPMFLKSRREEMEEGAIEGLRSNVPTPPPVPEPPRVEEEVREEEVREEDPPSNEIYPDKEVIPF